MIGSVNLNPSLARDAAGTAAGYRSSCVACGRIRARLCHALWYSMQRLPQCQGASADPSRPGMCRLPVLLGGQRAR